ncbi:MAG: hypothetical protein IH851_06010 [Armatimonadetes bacterium]|nr:hypothetical protein [Armatimonadota bacterium]
MKRTTRNKGTATHLMLFVVMVLVFGALSLVGLSSTSMNRSTRELSAAQAFQTAQALVDYEFQVLIERLEETEGRIPEYTRDLGEAPFEPPEGAEGIVAVTPFGDESWAWITADAYVGENARSVRLLVRAKNVGIWNNAVFAGSGATGQAIKGNVDIRGSVHLLGDGEAYTDLNGNGQWDDAEPFTDLNGNGVWDPGEPFVDMNGDGVWNPAEPYNDSNRNGVYDPPMTLTDLNSNFRGNAYIGNNYDGIPALIESKITPIPVLNGLKTLSADVRVKHGMIGISGTATIGLPGNPFGQQGNVDGTYVNDGWAGNQGASSVYSYNGTNEQYDLGNRVSFPLISGIGAQEYTDPSTGITYPNMQQYLDDNSLTIPLNSITNNTPAVSYSDGSGNSFQWIPPAGGNPGRLLVEGIIRIEGNLRLGSKRSTITYGTSGGPGGRGTLYSTRSIDVHANLIPEDGIIFPTGVVLGLLAAEDIDLATSGGDAQLTMIGAFYAQGVITSRKQNQIAGTFVANYYDMGTNVPNIYQVPALANHLPPGMPGNESIFFLKRKTWRDRVPEGTG